MGVYESIYPEIGAGGFSRYDGTVQFFSRVNALLDPTMEILDFGAGRGLLAEHRTPIIRALTNFRGRVRKVTGVDIDRAVYDNPTLDVALEFDGNAIPLPDQSVDLICSDHVFEHLPHPAQTANELFRVLKPGGWLCARTPHLYSALFVGSSIIPNSRHAAALQKIQPGGRKALDVFPTFYRLNSRRALHRHFDQTKWTDCSYTWNPEPSYIFGSRAVARVMSVYQYLKAPFFGGEVLLVFMRKK